MAKRMRGGGDMVMIGLVFIGVLFILIGGIILVMNADELTRAKMGTAFGLMSVGTLLMFSAYWYNSYYSIQGF